VANDAGMDAAPGIDQLWNVSVFGSNRTGKSDYLPEPPHQAILSPSAIAGQRLPSTPPAAQPDLLPSSRRRIPSLTRGRMLKGYAKREAAAGDRLVARLGRAIPARSGQYSYNLSD
jgi:hypothetical protein